MTGRHATGRPVAPTPAPTPQPSARVTLWPTVAALGVMAGILAATGQWLGLLPALLGLFLIARGGRWAQLLLLLGGLGAGFWSATTVQRQPDTLAPWIGARVTLQGHWDGQFLRLSDPGARVALSPRPTARPGQLTVGGVLVRPSGPATPGGFDQARWLSGQGGLFLPTPKAVLVAAQVKATQPEKGVRAYLLSGLQKGLKAEQAALLQAIELGDRQALRELEDTGGPSLQDAFARTGLSHLMALSGQNVALITGFVLLLLGRTRMPKPWQYAFAALLLLLFLWVVGLSPSIFRAVLMGWAVLLGWALGRGRPDPLATLSLAALICLLPFPLWLFDLGFQLSFLAVLGLGLTPQLMARLPQRWPFWLRTGLAATMLAELATLPLIAGTFGQIPLVGVFTNLLAAPLMSVLVPLGLVAALLGPLAGVVNWLLGPLLGLLIGLARTFAAAPTLPWGHISAAGYLAYALFALAGASWLWGRLRGTHLLGIAFCAALLTFLPAQLRPARELVFLDVGQGDSTVVRDGSFAMLIDGGGTPHSDFDLGERVVVPALRSLGIVDLDVVVATHADADHIEGLLAVLRQVRVGELWIGRRDDAPLMSQLLREAAQRGVRVREVRRGDTVQRGSLALTVLWPTGNAWSTEDNENSVALRLQTAGGWKTAFLGDLPASVEPYLGVGRLNLLKVAHHGSRHSTGAALLQETKPTDALISVGRNTFGHPHSEVLERLGTQQIRVWRTDQAGTVRWPLPR